MIKNGQPAAFAKDRSGQAGGNVVDLRILFYNFPPLAGGIKGGG